MPEEQPSDYPRIVRALKRLKQLRLIESYTVTEEDHELKVKFSKKMQACWDRSLNKLIDTPEGEAAVYMIIHHPMLSETEKVESMVFGVCRYCISGDFYRAISDLDKDASSMLTAFWMKNNPKKVKELTDILIPKGIISG